MARSSGKLVAGAVLALAVAAAGAWFALDRRRPYDPAFDTRVTDPAHPSGGPVILYDEAHLNTHAAGGAYKPFTDLLRNDGHEVRVTREPLSAAALEGVAVLVIALARGANDANDDPAFTGSEVAAVDRWVRDGGSLLLVTDHWPYGAAMTPIAEPFGIRMGKGLVEDPEHCDPVRGSSHLIFSDGNDLLRDHPLVRGRGDAERIRQVLTFTGQALFGPPSAVPFLALSPTATERPPTEPGVEKSGGDVRVNMEYGDPVPAAGGAQGLALEIGRGRVVVLGEAGMLRATRGDEREKVGMNVSGFDNRQLALNVVRWLSRAI